MSVVLPSTQRSWIGKAHLLPPSTYPLSNQIKPSVNETVDDLCVPEYYNPQNGSVHKHPLEAQEYWVLVPGTPATCTQLGLFHYKELFPFRESSKIDLVLSGPNHGRNTTAAFALSSGTLGGALEGAVSGIRGIALSFAFFTRQESDELVKEASGHSIKIVEKLCSDWKMAISETGQPTDASDRTPDVYTINVPLVNDVSKNPIHWTWMLDNKWPTGSLYTAVNGASTAEASSPSRSQQPPAFKWSPSFGDIWKIVEQSPAGNDGKVIRDGGTSITPIKASFQGLHGRGNNFTGEFKL